MTPRVVALLLAASLLPLARGAEGEGLFVQSTWGAKFEVGLVSWWWKGRPLWVERAEGRGVRVGILDSGIDPHHPDLSGALEGFRDFVGDVQGEYHQTPYDDHGHGTAIASIVAGRGHLQGNPLLPYFPLGLRGIAPSSKLLVAKVLPSFALPHDSEIASGLRFLLDPNGDGDFSDGSHILLISLGVEGPWGPTPLPTRIFGPETLDAVRLAIERGVPVVVPAGNDGQGIVSPLCEVSGVICVGGVDRSGFVPSFSNWGRSLDLVAPSALMVGWSGEGGGPEYVPVSGTSFAAGVVAGVVALALESHPSWKDPAGGKEKVLEIERILRAHARRVPNPDNTEGGKGGAGSLDAEGLLSEIDEGSDRISLGNVLLFSLPGVLWVGAWALSRRRRRRS